ncbi:hypothetical protein BpHYR1_024409 [Brachionus plicatilis]|uniref:Uncharacterized protein n=1 Tax=Brachionus plicatilis TaxID=10195 RepID=A0A3M7QVU3_BRAPC|nr:hypothetical protein BpHYR1_024409 [Brachionus plicatilis]
MRKKQFSYEKLAKLVPEIETYIVKINTLIELMQTLIELAFRLMFTSQQTERSSSDIWQKIKKKPIDSLTILDCKFSVTFACLNSNKAEKNKD